MPPERTGMPPRPTRRVLVSGGLAALGVWAVSGCGIRLEDDAPRVPLIPARQPVRGESYLLHLRRRSAELAAQAAALGGARTSVPARLAVLHRQQVDVLETELLRLGVPQRVIDAAQTAAPTGSGTASSGTASSGTAATARAGGAPTVPSTPVPAPSGPLGLAAAEASDLGPSAFASLAGMPAASIPLVGALLAQRAAAAALLGSPSAPPDPAWSAPSLAASFLDSTRSAIYAFEVVAAQSLPGAQRTLATATLATLQARAQAQEALAAASAGPPALGYPLPFAVTTPVAARRLAVQVLSDLRAAVARDLGSAGPDAGPLGSVTYWLADTEILASRWGLPLSAFPGLR